MKNHELRNAYNTDLVNMINVICDGYKVNEVICALTSILGSVIEKETAGIDQERAAAEEIKTILIHFIQIHRKIAEKEKK